MSGRPRVFGIGFHKTGTTSLAAALDQLGYLVAPQPPAARLVDEVCRQGCFENLFRFCSAYSAFQDTPFSLPGVYRALDEHFPGSRFILTVRDDPDAWFDSLQRYTSKRFENDHGQPPTLDNLKVLPMGTDFVLYKVHTLVFQAQEKGISN